MISNFSKQETGWYKFKTEMTLATKLTLAGICCEMIPGTGEDTAEAATNVLGVDAITLIYML
jgi:hypothetical protein